jgi:Cu(I)/Ag(I) efflux system membrane protein CusA/SilA
MESIYTPILTFFKMEKISASSKYCCFTNWGLMFTQLGSEFMPPLDEGSILFMPVTLPDVSNSEIKRIQVGQINKETLRLRMF